MRLTNEELDKAEYAMKRLYTPTQVFADHILERYPEDDLDAIIALYQLLIKFDRARDKNISIRYSFNAWSLQQRGELLEMPTLFQMAKNFATTLTTAAQNGWKLSTDEEVVKRWSICESCEFISDFGRCFKCGCYMKIKVKLQAAVCPEKKW